MARRIPSLSLLTAAALLVVFSVEAAPAKKTPPAKTPPAVDAGVVTPPEAKKEEPPAAPQFRVAITTFTGVNVKPELLSFYTEHFGAALAANGVKVTTPSQISAVLGLERQKQLLGCNEGESCIMELGNALGVDGIVTATLAMLDSTYRLNIKIVSASTGELLSGSGAAASKVLKGQSAVADELTLAAKFMSERAASRAGRSLVKSGAVIAPQSLPKLTPENPVENKPEEKVAEVKPPPEDAPVENVEKKDAVVAQAPKEPPPVVEKPKEPPPPAKAPSNGGAKFLMVTGGVVGGVALVSLGYGVVTALRLRTGDTSIGSLPDATSLGNTAALFEFLGWSGLAVGVPLFFIGLGSYDSGPKVSAGMTVNGNGTAFVLEGTWP